MIKFNRNINDYQYILSFDLAKRVSGYTLFDFKNGKVLLCGIIDTKKSEEDFIWGYFFNEVKRVIQESVSLIGENKRDILFLTKEKLPTQNGRFSTIDTLQGLAQTHAVFDLAAYQSGIAVYDFDGVHSVSVKAYFKKILSIEKPQKEDIFEYFKKRFPDVAFENYPLDVTDSLAVTITLLEHKYQEDVLKEIRETKKELKRFKSKTKTDSLQKRIEFLSGLLK